MNKTIKQKWVNALRSGKYKQGYEALKCVDQYCCLGVLCDLAAKEDIGKWGEYGVFVTGKTKSGGYLPNAVMKWAGLSRRYGISVAGKDLAHMNDEKVSFKEIADIIEKRA